MPFVGVKTVRYYKCCRCRTRYSSLKQAENCEKRLIEKKVFKVRDRIETRGRPAHCSFTDRWHKFSGFIVKISGPKSLDSDYAARMGLDANTHIFEYFVQGVCSGCAMIREKLYYARDLKKV